MSTFTHNGITIELSASGKFSAVKNGQTFRASSLDAIKKQLDNADKQQFKPFTALREHYGEIKTETVIGVKESRNRFRRDRHEFIVQGSNETHDSLIADTPENRAAIKAARAHQEETRAIRDRRDKEYEKLRAKIVRVEANDYAPKRPEKE